MLPLALIHKNAEHKPYSLTGGLNPDKVPLCSWKCYIRIIWLPCEGYLYVNKLLCCCCCLNLQKYRNLKLIFGCILVIKCWTCRHFESQSFLILGVDAPCIIVSVMNFGLHRARLMFLVWQLIKNIFFILLVDRPAAQKHLHIYQFLPADRINEEAPSRKTKLREPLDVFPPQVWDLIMLHCYA